MENLEDISYDWCLGKPAGFVHDKHKGKKYDGAIWRYGPSKDKQRLKSHSKSFPSSKYNNSLEEARLAALNYQYEWSVANGYIKNQVRRLPDGIYWKDDPENYPVTRNTLEVFICKGDEGNDITMLIDFEDLPIVQKYYISKIEHTYRGQVMETYAQVSVKGEVKKFQFHKFITKFELTDHNNRNTLDNRRCNLRDSTFMENMNNKNTECPGMDQAPEGIERVPGVKQLGHCWEAYISKKTDPDSGDETLYRASFNIKILGNYKACEMAVQQRKLWALQLGNKNSYGGKFRKHSQFETIPLGVRIEDIGKHAKVKGVKVTQRERKGDKMSMQQQLANAHQRNAELESIVKDLTRYILLLKESSRNTRNNQE